MTARTCFTWYGMALLPSRCKLILFYACLSKQMMAAFHPLVESQAFQQGAEIVKTDRRIGGPAEELAKSLGDAHRNIVLRSLRCATSV